MEDDWVLIKEKVTLEIDYEACTVSEQRQQEYRDSKKVHHHIVGGRQAGEKAAVGG